MTINDLQRAALALYAAKAAGEGAPLEEMRAICICVRNRVWGGWFDGSWLTILEHAQEVEANERGEGFYLDPNSRALQRLISEVDDIYYTGRVGKSPTYEKKTMAQAFAPAGGDLADALDRCCYWYYLNRPVRPWFKKNILDRPAQHPPRPQMGLMMFFE